jgi:hypothetical protein
MRFREQQIGGAALFDHDHLRLLRLRRPDKLAKLVNYLLPRVQWARSSCWR